MAVVFMSCYYLLVLHASKLSPTNVFERLMLLPVDNEIRDRYRFRRHIMDYEGKHTERTYAHLSCGGRCSAVVLYTCRDQRLLFVGHLFYSCPATTKRGDLFLFATDVRRCRTKPRAAILA